MTSRAKREIVAVVDYGSGNLRSVQKAFERAARERGLAADIQVTSNAAVIAAADRIVLPGVGAFGATMAGLAAANGVIEALEHAALVRRQPFLGICVGLQLLAERGLEFGEARGLGWLPGVVRRLAPKDEKIRIPHVGWNTVELSTPHPALGTLSNAPRDFYFTHSYHFAVENDAYILGICEYGERFAAIVGRDNILATQFHPEKSQDAGIGFIGDFMQWSP